MIENRNDKFDLKYVVSRVLREDKETRTNEWVFTVECWSTQW